MAGDRQGGRPPCPQARHFKPLAEMGLAGGGYSYRECSFCRAAYENNEATRPPKIIIGRARNYVSHLATCEFYQAAQAPSGSPCSSVAPTTPAATPAASQGPNSASAIEATPTGAPRPLSSPTASQCADSVSSQTRSRAASHSRARRCLVLEKRPPPSHKRRKSPPAKKLKQQNRKFKKAEIKNIERALIEAHADNHLPDRLIEQETILRFLELLCPGISDILPSRRTLGGRIRQEHAARCKAVDCEALKIMAENTGGWVNLLSDVWQNISKQHLLGCQLALFGILHTYDLLPAGDRHHGIAIAKELEQVLEQARQDKWRVGAIVTDNAGQCGRARRILAIRWPHIVFLFCFAHDVNNLVKAVLRSAFRDVAAKAATSVNTLNASSSKWLPRARKMMKRFYGRALGLRTLCETRWNSMQGCFASLLRVQSALHMFCRQYKSNKDFPKELHVFGDSLFWDELKEAESVISPLSYASFRLQRDENTVGDVVRSFRDIHSGFQQHLVRRDKLVKCVEDRWAQCEQPLFMLGFALHPGYVEYAKELPDTAVSGVGALCKIAVYYYRRLFNTEDIGQIRRDMLAWMKGRLTRTKPGEFLDSPWEYWECVAMECPKSLLPKLAIRVLSVAVNTATCERLFSELGMIHTAKRNRMNSSKALDFHTIAKHVRQRLRKEAVASKNPKKKLLISPKERNIILDAATRSSLFTPSPQQHAVVNTDADSDDEDPGDGVDGPPTFALWGEYLKEVFEDGEIEADYAGNGRNPTDADAGASTGHNAADDSVRVSREQRDVRGSRENDSDSENDNEFEEIPAAIKHPFTEENDRRFSQEPVKLQRFRGQKETLAKLFG